VLGFPPKAPDPAIDLLLRGATNPQRGFAALVLPLLSHNGGVGNLLNQAETKRGRGYTELDLPRREVFLRDRTGPGVAGNRVIDSPTNHEQRMHRLISLEAHLHHRAIGPDERRDRITRPPSRRERYLRIGRWTGAANGRMRMAARAAIEVEAGAEALLNLFGLHKLFTPLLKQCSLLGTQSLQHASCIRPWARAWVLLGLWRGGDGEHGEHKRRPESYLSHTHV
jgi:hypothetical protein